MHLPFPKPPYASPRGYILALLLLVVVGLIIAIPSHLRAQNDIAKTSQQLTELQKNGTDEADVRLIVLHNLKKRVADNPNLTADEKKAVQKTIYAQIQLLLDRKFHMMTDSSAQQVQDDRRALHALHIDELAIPTLNLTIATNTLDHVLANYTQVADGLEKKIAAHIFSASEKSTYTSDLADLRQNLTGATTISAQLHAILPQLTLAKYPATTPLLQTAVASLPTADAKLNKAEEDAGSVVRALHDAAIVSQSAPISGSNILPGVAGTPIARILMYHYIRSNVDPDKDPLGFRLSITPDTLDAELTAFQSAGYSLITMSDVAAGRGGVKSMVLTFDDGYSDFYTAAFPILKKHGMKATAYIITGKVGTPNYMTWDQIKEISKAGFEIGAHTVNHLDLSTLSRAAQQKEIVDSKKTLESELGIPITAFCYPSGRYNDTTEQIVQQAGFTSATTTQPSIARAGNDRFAIPRLRISPYTATSYLTQ